MCASTGAASCRRRPCCSPFGQDAEEHRAELAEGVKLDEDERRTGGMSPEEILGFFYDTVAFTHSKKGGRRPSIRRACAGSSSSAT